MRPQDRAYDDLMRQLATVLAWVVMAMVAIVLYLTLRAVVPLNDLLLRTICIVGLVTSAPSLARLLRRRRPALKH